MLDQLVYNRVYTGCVTSSRLTNLNPTVFSVVSDSDEAAGKAELPWIKEQFYMTMEYKVIYIQIHVLTKSSRSISSSVGSGKRI